MKAASAAPELRDGFLCHPLLGERGVAHGFGLRDAEPPAGLRRPRQVHGHRVVQLSAAGGELGDADAVVSALPGVPVGVVTADCVPVLLCDAAGAAVAAVHAGWRGLAAGVVAEALGSLADLGCAAAGLAAVVGPHIGGCCYEVDAPVLEALGARFAAGLDSARHATRPGHARVDLGQLVRSELEAGGVGAVAALEQACTRCQPERFHSYRRDGAAAGRLVHWIAPIARA